MNDNVSRWLSLAQYFFLGMQLAFVIEGDLKSSWICFIIVLVISAIGIWEVLSRD